MDKFHNSDEFTIKTEPDILEDEKDPNLFNFDDSNFLNNDDDTLVWNKV